MGFLNRFLSRSTREQYKIYTDGSIRPEKHTSGLAAAVQTETGEIRWLWACRSGALTCNEAEYAAAIMALEGLCASIPSRRWRQIEINLFSDSQVMVQQMRGAACIHSFALRKLQLQLRTLSLRFARVSFHHIPREQNRLADALANDAVEGRPTGTPHKHPVKIAQNNKIN